MLLNVSMIVSATLRQCILVHWEYCIRDQRLNAINLSFGSVVTVLVEKNKIVLGESKRRCLINVHLQVVD
jgi:hypothetical protein